MDKNTKWLNNCTFLCSSNKIIHGCKEIQCNNVFLDKNSNIYTHSTNQSSYDKHNDILGVFTHTDCWKFIKKEYDINLNYSYLPINIFDVTKSKIFNFVNYGIVEKYWRQYFDFIQTIIDNNYELVYSPLKNIQVAKNIKKIFTKLKIRTDEKRQGPIVSATFYKPNTYRVGINGNIWHVKANKWIKIKDTIKINCSIQNKNIFKDAVFIGEYNNIPLFINIKKNNKNIIQYEIFSTKEYILKKYPTLI